MKDTVMTEFSTVVKLEVNRFMFGVPFGLMAGLLFKSFSRMSMAKCIAVFNNFLGEGRFPDDQWILQQDNAPAHRSQAVTQFLRDCQVSTLK